MINVSGSVSQFLKGLDKDQIPIESLIGLPINDSNGNRIGHVTSINDKADLWNGEIECDIFKKENKVSMEINQPAIKYKKELISQVKILGQEIIDRAEEFVGNNDVRTSFEIKLKFEQQCVPEIEYKSTHMSRKIMDVYEMERMRQLPLTYPQSGIPLNAIREVFGADPIK